MTISDLMLPEVFTTSLQIKKYEYKMIINTILVAINLVHNAS